MKQKKMLLQAGVILAIALGALGLASAGEFVQLQGRIYGLDVSTHTFMVQGLRVYYGDLNLAGQLQEGAVVKVMGWTTTQEGAISAAELRVEGMLLSTDHSASGAASVSNGNNDSDHDQDGDVDHDSDNHQGGGTDVDHDSDSDHDGNGSDIDHDNDSDHDGGSSIDNDSDNHQGGGNHDSDHDSDSDSDHDTDNN